MPSRLAHSLERHAAPLVLMAWLGLVLGLLVSGAYRNYVADWHWSLQAMTALILALTLVGLLAGDGGDGEGTGHHHHGPDCGCGHPQGAAGRPARLVLALVPLAPLVLFLAVGPGALSMVPGGGGLQGPGGNGRIQPANQAPAEYTPDGYLMTNLLEVHTAYDQSGGMPEKVRVVGRLFTFPPDQRDKVPAALRKKGVDTYLYRFVIVCCAADARPLSVAVLSGKPLKVDIDQWYEVKGRPSVFKDGESEILTMEVDSVSPVKPPPVPYLQNLF